MFFEKKIFDVSKVTSVPIFIFDFFLSKNENVDFSILSKQCKNCIGFKFLEHCAFLSYFQLFGNIFLSKVQQLMAVTDQTIVF